jgi:plasmid rolling circle replication initiator protein Rep
MKSNLLHELSPGDAKFMQHKFDSVNVAFLLKELGDYKHSSRMLSCAKNLSFRILDDGTYKLHQTYVYKAKKKLPLIQFCKIRFCPLCQWRRSKVWKHKLFTAIPRILQDFPDCRFLFLTLTIINPPLLDMRSALNDMAAAYKNMSRQYEKSEKRSTGNKFWPAIGHIRFTEVTKGNVSGRCHPHFHCLLLVSNSYFENGNYLTAEQWGDMWREYMSLDYRPSVKIMAVKGDYLKIIPEICKYASKNTDLLDDEFLNVYKDKTKYYHLVEVYGVLSDYIKKPLTEEDENLIDYANKEHDFENSEVKFFRWQQTDIQLLEGNYRWDYQLVN